MRSLCSALVVTLAAACGRPQPEIICHNSNCTTPDTTRDDTVDALRESLALGVLDGVEWDTFWYSDEERCLFAHDLDHDVTTPASAAADIVAEHLAGRSGGHFTVLVDLKPFVGTSYGDRHTPAQLAAHVACGLDGAERVVAGAAAGGVALTFAFVSAKPAMLDAVAADPRWRALAGTPGIETMLVADIFAPYAPIVPELSQFRVALDGVEYHPDFLTAAQRETYASLGLDLVQWSFVATPETFDAIARYEPRFVLTNDAVLMRRWESY